MADRLAKLYGTWMDKVNCPFFYKIGLVDMEIVAKVFIISLQLAKLYA